jgi:hypothetical protein
MKTALQELIEGMELFSYQVSKEGNLDMVAAFNFAIDLAKLKIEKEKDQLQVSFISGAIEALSSHTPVRDRIKDGYFEDKAEQYFNHIYRQNYTNEN